MTKINLRNYNQEIRRRMAAGNFEEAIQHCLYILNIFPKLMETYRILGESYLEMQQYQKAIIILKRVLSIVPDDFLAHVGLSVVFESTNQLNEARWHMERAFDIQPAHIAVRNELMRLYSWHNGAEPKDILLTRAALSRLYLQGRLYPQAIAELKAGLLDHPDRIDLHLMLAQAYFLNDQPFEAIAPCKIVLRQSPFCMEANRLFYFVTLDAGDEPASQTCQRRLIALDPYFQFLSPGQQTTEMVDDDVIELDWLAGFPEPEDNLDIANDEDLGWVFEPDINDNHP